MAKQDDLEPHLRDRLGEARDFADFSGSRAAAAGTPEGQEVTREIVIPGAEHLGGRSVQDTFKRTGRRPVASEPAKPGKKKLEHHLAARLAEVHDEMVGGGADAAVQAYRELRRKMGGA
jgi:hypothetical protein